MVITNDEEYFDKYERDTEEVMREQMMDLNYPKPEKKYRLIYESFQSSMEEHYFWLLNYMQYDLSFVDIEKITDIFSATETSAFGGVTHQRVGMSQDKVSQYLGVIGKMIKELFALVRELRILDERLSYYRDSYSSDSKVATPAEITLKGLFVDQAEGGSKSPVSVFGMAQQLQFTTLPDLFFSTLIQKVEEIDKKVDALEFNKAVKNVLKRKLHTFLKWKDHTFKEMKSRRIFTLRYLKQHYDVIKMYMSWVKPYLRRIRRLQGDEQALERPELITAFETSMIEIEILGKYKPKGNKDYFSIVLLSFDYVTKPAMNYQAEGYQRGPLHVGKMTINYRTYSWTQKDIDNYKALRDREDFEMLKMVDNSVRTAMDALGGDLENYLAEAGEEGFEKKEDKEEAKKEPTLPGLLEPFHELVKGFSSPLKAKKSAKPKKPSKEELYRLKEEKAKAKSEMKGKVWLLYKNFKKAHKMLAW